MAAPDLEQDLTQDLTQEVTQEPAAEPYQADYENYRQRLALDLLFGRVVPGHSLWRSLLWLGAIGTSW